MGKENESELLEKARNNDDAAFEELLKMYSGMIKGICYYYRNYHWYFPDDDAMQTGRMALLNAIKYYDYSKGVPFENFLRICCRRSIGSWARKEYYNTHHNTRAILSLDSSLRDSDTVYSYDQLTTNDPRQQLKDRQVLMDEMMAEVKNVIRSRTGFDEKVLDLYVQGFSYEEIAERLSCSRKKVDNCIYRIKRKVRRYYQDQD